MPYLLTLGPVQSDLPHPQYLLHCCSGPSLAACSCTSRGTLCHSCHKTVWLMPIALLPPLAAWCHKAHRTATAVRDRRLRSCCHHLQLAGQASRPPAVSGNTGSITVRPLAVTGSSGAMHHMSCSCKQPQKNLGNSATGVRACEA